MLLAIYLMLSIQGQFQMKLHTTVRTDHVLIDMYVRTYVCSYVHYTIQYLWF